MSIKLFASLLQSKPVDDIYTNSSRRSTAAAIDIMIVLFLRIFAAQLLGSLWFNYEVLSFLQEFKTHFGTESIKGTKEHIAFIQNHSIFYKTLFFYSTILFVGALYYAPLNSSIWRATIGKRIMKTMIVNVGDDSRISLGKAFSHYFLAILPFIYIFFLVAYQLSHNLNFYQAVTASPASLFLGLLFLVWVQIHLFTKKKVTAYDLICKTVYINGRADAKFPWSKSVN